MVSPFLPLLKAAPRVARTLRDDVGLAGSGSAATSQRVRRAGRFVRWVQDYGQEGLALFPTVSKLRSELAALFSIAREEGVVSPAERPLFPPKMKRKYKYNKDKYPNLSLSFSVGLSFLHHVMPPRVAGLWHTTVRRLFPSDLFFFDDTVVIKLLKKLGDIYKRGGSEFEINWKWYVSLSTCGGYRDPDLAELDLKAEAERWVGEPISYDPLMRKGRSWRWAALSRLLPRAPPKVDLSVAAFLADPTNYATTGSGRGLPKLTVEARYWDAELGGFVEGKYKFKSSKWAGALASTPAELERLLMRDAKQHNYMFLKPDELEKLRTIVVGDVPTLLKMSYLDVFVQEALRGCTKIPLFWSDEQRRKFWAAVREGSNDTATWKFPIDQSAFDEHVSLEILLDVVGWLVELAVMTAVDQAPVRRVGELLLRALDGGILETAEGYQVPIKKGVLSGWKWTALLDSLINYLQFCEICDFVGVDLSRVSDVAFQGDDVTATFLDPLDPVAVYAGYKRYGLEVNPFKFWIEPGRNEFLRKVGEGGRIFGYPARLVSGLLWHRPRSAPTYDEETWHEMQDSWAKLVSRGGVREVVERCVIEEAERVFKIPKDEAYALVHTPRTFGGAGWMPYGATFFGLDFTYSSRAHVLAADAPMLERFPLPYHGQMVDALLGSQLPQPPWSKRQFSFRRTPAELRAANVAQPEWDTTGIALAYVKPPRPRLLPDVRDGLLKMYVNIAARDDESALHLVYADVPALLLQKRHLGKRNWLNWLKGDLFSTPLSATDPLMLQPLVSYYAASVWARIPKVSLVILQTYVQYLVSVYYPIVSEPLYGQ